MPQSPSQSSFIPKRGATRAKKRKPVRQIFIFTILAYSLMFATLLAAGASYLYQNFLTSQMQNEIMILNSEINTFSISDLSRVSEFDVTLKRAADRFNNSASVVSVLDAIDAAAIEPIQFTALNIKRINDTQLDIAIEVVTDTFDGALFQRKTLHNDQALFSDVVIEDVVTSLAAGGAEAFVPDAQVVSFTVTLMVPIDQIPYRINNTNFDQTVNQLSL